MFVRAAFLGLLRLFLQCVLEIPSVTPTIMSQTIFEKIVAGTIPSYKLYEDEHVIAILDIFPAAKVRFYDPNQHPFLADFADTDVTDTIGPRVGCFEATISRYLPHS